MHSAGPLKIGLPGWSTFFAVLLAGACAQANGQVAPSSQAERPRVGLVLGGGGARGAAHIGVLEVLDRLRVPVDCVAGTSMGALMAGAWVAGRTPSQLAAAMAQADWNDMFQDTPDHREIDFHNKEVMRRFLPGSETGVGAGGAMTPPGVVLGQKIKLFLNGVVHADSGEQLIEKLPLPLSIIATDIGTGERIVYRDGSLTSAMRASMSVPGLIAPLAYRGRKVVDGGLVDNLPVREVRERCGASVVIAIDVGSQPLPADQVTGLWGITAQMVTLLTEQNVLASRAILRPSDIYIRPDLGDITSADFARHADAARRGHAAALAHESQLAALGVDEAQYTQWRRSMSSGPAVAVRIEEVQVVGLKHPDERLVRRHIEQQAGQPLNTAALNRDLMRAFGDGYYEQVDYSIDRVGSRNVLRVMPVEKSWGPDYFRMGVQLEDNLSQGSSYQLRFGYQKTWLNDRGGELLFTGELGGRTGVGVDYYQPLSASNRWFGAASASLSRERLDHFYLDQRIATYTTTRTQLELAAGIDLPRLGQLSAGWRLTRASNHLDTGLDFFSLAPSRNATGLLLRADMDRFDRLHFPRRGWSLNASWFIAPGADYSREHLDLRGAWPLGEHVLGARLRWTGSGRGILPLQDAARLGGFLNLTGYAAGQLIGDDVAYGNLRLERIIGRLPLGLRGDMRIGVALEAGKLARSISLQPATGWLGSVAVYLGGETPIGPAYVGVGRGSAGATNLYLFIGTP